MLKRLKANIKNLKECSDLHAIHTLLWLYDIEHESRMDSYSNDEIRFHNRYLNEEQKQTETETFQNNLLQGRFSYHFRDIKDNDEPQYFGKIHTRNITQEET